jgi:hypothetical protein
VWKPQRISVAGDSKQHRATTSFPGTRSAGDRIIAGSLLQNSKKKEYRQVLLLSIKFLYYLTALIQMKKLYKIESGELVQMLKNELEGSLNLLCRQSIMVSEENQIRLQSCNHPKHLNTCLSSVRTTLPFRVHIHIYSSNWLLLWIMFRRQQIC